MGASHPSLLLSSVKLIQPINVNKGFKHRSQEDADFLYLSPLIAVQKQNSRNRIPVEEERRAKNSYTLARYTFENFCRPFSGPCRTGPYQVADLCHLRFANTH